MERSFFEAPPAGGNGLAVTLIFVNLQRCCQRRRAASNPIGRHFSLDSLCRILNLEGASCMFR
jgi:hypothetical protein